MLKRVLSGIVYVIILVFFFALKMLVEPYWMGMLLFDLLIVIFSIIGTIEIVRAFSDKLILMQKIVINIFSTGSIICYAVSDAVFKVLRESNPLVVNYSPNFAFVIFGAGMALLFSVLVFANSKVTLESIGYSLIAFLYPSAFLLVLSGVNHMPNVYYSELAILFVFAICPIADTFAFFTGSLLGKKLPLKLSPNISPNKTVIGWFGGLLGGALGSVAIYFVYFLLRGAEANAQIGNILFYLSLGILIAAFASFGDLVESAIKRKLNIKDMGKIMPGHGGILDRIDSTLYASLIVCLVFVVRIMTGG